MNLQKKQQKIYNKQKIWEQKKSIILVQQELKKDKKQIKRKERKTLTTTKFLMFFLFTSCTVIEAFTLIITLFSIKQGVYDFTALQMLITAVVGEVIAFAVYSLKSVKQNTKGGIIYDTAMQNYQINSISKEEENNEQEAQG